ncbi:MAG: NAD-dependent epimerase/dehydratase family protein [Bacteriovoracia bacterium]
MKALVTGCSGFIGSEVLRGLTRRNIDVRALLRKTSSRQNLKEVKYEEAIGDLQDFDSLLKAVEGVDYVFHLAGSIFARSKDEFFKHNAKGTSNLARACAERNPNLKRFVYVSSLAASGPASSDRPKTESEEVCPVSDYGLSKLEGEKELLKWAKDFSTSIVRPPVVYGPRDKGVLEFIKIVNAGFLPVFPSSNKKNEKLYSVIYVEDLVEAIIEAGLSLNQADHEIYHISDNENHSWNEILTSVSKVLNKKPITLKLPRFAWKGLASAYTVAGWALKKDFPLTLGKLKELEQDYWICTNEKAKQKLGFHPKFDLKKGMETTVRWYKDNGWI